MRSYEQIAIRTSDIDKRIERVGVLHPYFGSQTPYPEIGYANTKWVRDEVHAEHVYVHPAYMGGRVTAGMTFGVRLAFNYQLIPTRELELIQLLHGDTVQLRQDRGLVVGDEGLSHLGYHVPDGYRLRQEIRYWNDQNFVCAQVSCTTVHSGTSKRYVYAFIDTRHQIGAWTKIISRVTIGEYAMREEFENVNKS